MSTSTLPAATDGCYRHEAFFYDGDDDFMDGTLGFIRDAVAEDEPILVVLAAERIAALRHELGDEVANVEFADMNTVGDNPARIIPAWQAFLGAHARSGVRVRGIGEPISAARSADELAECHRHEALLNIAFADPDFWLLCPYDTQALDVAVIDEARRTHPFVRNGRVSATSAGFLGNTAIAEPFNEPLPEPITTPRVLAFDRANLRDVRTLVETSARVAGLNGQRTADLVVSAYELSTNSVQHGGGHGTLRIWIDDGDVTCEVRDSGRITDPMLGRIRPSTEAVGGRGLWLANQLCDLVQLRSFPGVTVTRLHMRGGQPAG
jgi:anti-sigma regulatory factor (Ser/Thr protein kinase)